MHMPGVILTVEEVKKLRGLPIGEGNESLEFFERSRDKLLLRGTDTYWHTIRERLPSDLNACIPCYHSGDNMPEEAILDPDIPGNPIGTGKCRYGVVESSLAGATNEVRTLSTYEVPSQMSQSTATDIMGSGSGLAGEYMHIYQHCGKLADGLKEFGSEEILSNALNKARSELMKLADDHGQRETFCNAKKAKRLKRNNGR